MIDPEYIAFSTSPTLAAADAGLVLEPLHVAGDDVVAAAHLGDRGFELADHGLGLGEHRALGQRRPPVAEVVDRAVVLLDHEELLERRRHRRRNVSAAGRGPLAARRAAGHGAVVVVVVRRRRRSRSWSSTGSVVDVVVSAGSVGRRRGDGELGEARGPLAAAARRG